MDVRVNAVPAALAPQGARPAHDEVGGVALADLSDESPHPAAIFEITAMDGGK